MYLKPLLLLVFLCYVTVYGARIKWPTPPKWPLVWMTSGSAFNPYDNQTYCAQIFYDWRRPAQVINFMRNDSYVYTVLNVGNVVWRLERANQSCCVDPEHTGVTPPRPDWLQIGNETIYDGIVSVMEHECHSWTKTEPGVATFSWLASVATGIPCRLGWLAAIQFDFSFFSDNPDIMPRNIFDVPDYCPGQVTVPNCNVMPF